MAVWLGISDVLGGVLNLDGMGLYFDVLGRRFESGWYGFVF